MLDLHLLWPRLTGSMVGRRPPSSRPSSASIERRLAPGASSDVQAAAAVIVGAISTRRSWREDASRYNLLPHPESACW